MFLRAALATSVVLGLAVPIRGQALQPRAGRAPGVIQLMPIQLEGTVAAVRPGMVAVTTAAGETWALRIPRQAEIRVTGTAEPDVLRPGLYVRFIAPVDKRRSRVEEKVGKLTIFSPSQGVGRMPGVFYPGQEGEAPGLQPKPGMPPRLPRPQLPGVQPDAPQPQEGPAPRRAARGREAEKRPKTGTDIETFDIRAQIKAVKGRWLTVYARNAFFKPTLRFELTDKPEITLDLNSYTLAKSGDKISARGVQIAPQAVQAMRVEIELAEPLSNSRKKPKRPAGKRPPGRPSKQGQGRQPFEVAQEIEQEKRGKPEQPKQPRSEEKPLPKDERSKKIVEFLKPKPEEIKGKPGLRINLGQNGLQTFTPCKEVTGKEVLGKFGLPDRVRNASGSLPIGEAGERKEVKWQLWVYGPVKFLVDEADKTRYITVTVEKKQEPPKQPAPKK